MLTHCVVLIFLVLAGINAEINKIPLNQRSSNDIQEISRRKSSIKSAEKRIFGGETAVLGQFPYQVLLDVVSNINDSCCRMICGGAVIDEYWVLTAAHCFFDQFEYVELKFGVISTRWSVYETTVQKQNVKIHEDYNSDNPFENDVALIKVPKSYYRLFVYPYVDLVELPESDENFVGMTATVSGFGQTEKGNSEVLKYVDLPVMENMECSKLYTSVKILDSHICGRTTVKTGMCHGDSGGPYVVEKNYKKILVGIVSFGTSDCDIGYPDVFTRVTHYLDWIHGVMKNSSSTVSDKKVIYVLILIVIFM